MSITGLQDLLSEGLACGAGDTEPFLKLDEWHRKAVQWRTTVAGVLKDLEVSEEVSINLLEHVPCYIPSSAHHPMFNTICFNSP